MDAVRAFLCSFLLPSCGKALCSATAFRHPPQALPQLQHEARPGIARCVLFIVKDGPDGQILVETETFLEFPDAAGSDGGERRPRHLRVSRDEDDVDALGIGGDIYGRDPLVGIPGQQLFLKSAETVTVVHKHFGITVLRSGIRLRLRRQGDAGQGSGKGARDQEQEKEFLHGTSGQTGGMGLQGLTTGRDANDFTPNSDDIVLIQMIPLLTIINNFYLKYRNLLKKRFKIYVANVYFNSII